MTISPGFLSGQMFPIADVNAPQGKNNAGGYVFAMNPWDRLQRFLILGTESSTYYVSQTTLTMDNVHSVYQCLKEDGIRAVDQVVAISQSGRAPKNTPALFTLAFAASYGDAVTRKAALQAIPQVCRTGTHLFEFAEYVNNMRGWGRSLRKGIGNWYTQHEVSHLVYQVIKYQQRENWSHRDLLRLCHPAAPDDTYNRLFKWIIDKEFDTNDCPDALRQLRGFLFAREAKCAGDIVDLIHQYRLPREAIPTEWLKSPAVWQALLQDMPLTAMIRNLATMTRIGMLTNTCNETQSIIDRLNNRDLIHKSRLHPIQVLEALLVYQSGHGMLGQQMWNPIDEICQALDRCFYLSFGNVEPTNARCLLALDVSGSMDWSQIAGVPGLTPRVASAALAMVTLRKEPNYRIMGFCDGLVSIPISTRCKLQQVVEKISSLPAGGTDCSLPMVWALQKKVPIDVFIIYTDSETWYGDIHPCKALQEYREGMQIPAKLIVVGMVSNGFSIADPNDPNSLDIVGFDTSVPNLMYDFITRDMPT